MKIFNFWKKKYLGKFLQRAVSLNRAESKMAALARCGSSVDLFCVIQRYFPWQIYQTSTNNVNLHVLVKKDRFPPRFLCKQTSVVDSARIGKVRKTFQRSIRQQEDHAEIKFQNKIKFRSDLPTLIFFAMVSETHTFFLAL